MCKAACGLQIEMYADPGARGGVLEPEGIVEIKFRAPDLVATMHRLDPIIQKLKAEGALGMDAAIKKRETELLPIYRQVSWPTPSISRTTDHGHGWSRVQSQDSLEESGSAVHLYKSIREYMSRM